MRTLRKIHAGLGIAFVGAFALLAGAAPASAGDDDPGQAEEQALEESTEALDAQPRGIEFACSMTGFILVGPASSVSSVGRGLCVRHMRARPWAIPTFCPAANRGSTLLGLPCEPCALVARRIGCRLFD